MLVDQRNNDNKAKKRCHIPLIDIISNRSISISDGGFREHIIMVQDEDNLPMSINNSYDWKFTSSVERNDLAFKNSRSSGKHSTIGKGNFKPSSLDEDDNEHVILFAPTYNTFSLYLDNYYTPSASPKLQPTSSRVYEDSPVVKSKKNKKRKLSVRFADECTYFSDTESKASKNSLSLR